MIVYSANPHKYNVSQVAEWFNYFPHLNITLGFVNSTFDPTNSAYLEAIGMMIAVPGFWLILTLLAFLVFFLCRCCDGNLNKKRKLTPLKWALVIVALLCCGALSVGLYGNHYTHEGMVKVENTPRALARLIASIRNETSSIEVILEEKVNPDLDKLGDYFKNPPSNKTVHAFLQNAVSDMRKNISEGINKIIDINTNLDRLEFDYIASIIEQVEFFRWPITMGILGLLILICFILIWGVIRHSRCLLILFSVLGLLSVVVCWICVSLYLGICVAGSDFCLQPEPFITKQANGAIYGSRMLPIPMDKASRTPGSLQGGDVTLKEYDGHRTDVLTYYLHCNEMPPNPFAWTVKDGMRSLDEVQSTLAQVKRIVIEYYKGSEIWKTVDELNDHINRSEKILQDLTTTLDCKETFKEYNSAMDAICSNILEGTSFMLASAAGSGFLFTVLIWVASHTWIHIRKKVSRREQLDEEDPFLPPSRRNHLQPAYGPRPRYSHTPPQTPHFTTSLNGRSGSREDQACLQGRYTPPPAYDNL